MPIEILVFAASSRTALAEQLAAAARPPAGSLAALALRQASRAAAPGVAAERSRLAILAEDLDDLRDKLQKARELLAGDRRRFNLANRILFAESPEVPPRMAFLFPGYGSQQTDLLGEMCRYASVRRWFSAIVPESSYDYRRYRKNRLLFAPADPNAGAGGSDPAETYKLSRLTDAVLLADLAHFTLLSDLGLACDAMAGHSYGEAALLVASGMASDVPRVGALLRQIALAAAPADAVGTSALLAVSGISRGELAAVLAETPHAVFLALDNCPQQVILCGESEEIARVEAEVKARRGLAYRLPRLEHAVHTPLFPVSPATLREIYAGLDLRAPSVPAYSSVTTERFPAEPEAIRALLARQWTTGVRFRETVERLYAEGIRTFVEVGPGGHLAGFVRDTLRGRSDVTALSTHRENVDPVLQLRTCVAQLFVLGYHLDLGRAALADSRSPAPVAPTAPPAPRTPEVPETPDARRRAMEEEVLRRLAEVLELSSPELIDPERGFFELGMGSLAAIDLSAQLGQLLGRPLAPTLVFDYPSVTRLAEHLCTLAEDRAGSPAAEGTETGKESGEPVAIVGIGCRLPGGADTPEAFWELLRRGEDAIREVPAGRWPPAGAFGIAPGEEAAGAWLGGFLDEVDGFDAEFFGVRPPVARALDPQQRLLLEVSWEAVERAGLSPRELAGTAGGVFVGVGASDYVQRLTPRRRLEAGPSLDSGTAQSTAAGRVARSLGLTGPCLAVDTACSSALVAVHLACQSLREHECDLALAGGVNLLLSPETGIFLAQARALAPDGRCKSFDASADGYVRSEGCGMVVLRRYRDAVAAGDPILAVIRGSAINHDGHASSLMVPNGLAQQAVVRLALADAGVAPGEISYVEAHGTGTALGDPIEVGALGRALSGAGARDGTIFLGSVKSNFGHQEAAAGIVGLLKVVLQMRHRRLVPSLHCTRPNPQIDWARLPFTVCSREAEWDGAGHPLTAGVSAFGISGTNAHVILQEAPPLDGGDRRLPHLLPPRAHHLLTLSGKSAAALAASAARWEAHLRARPALDLADTCWTSNVGRTHFPYRRALLVQDRDEALAGLLAATASGSGRPRRRRARLAFLFADEGTWTPGMGTALFASEPAFRGVLEECEALLCPTLRVSIQDLLCDGGGAAPPPVALLARQVALARLWQSWGIQPDLVLGHGAGESAAAVVSGASSLADGLRRAAAPGRPGGTRVEKGLPDLRRAGCDLVLVIGALPEAEGRTARGLTWLPSLDPAWDERKRVLATLGRLYEAGFEVEWRGFHAGRAGLRVELPTYPFQRKRFWIGEESEQEAVP